MDGKTEPNTRVIRGCSTEPAKTSNFCIERAGTGENTKNRYCMCDSDACNPAGRNVAVNTGILATIVFLLYNLA